jgi:OFA family oxalate/formate antiporter-like MFS transporter
MASLESVYSSEPPEFAPISDKQAKRLAYRSVLAAWLACICLFGYRTTFAVIKVPIAAEMHWSSASITSGYSLMMLIYAVAAFFSGVILDRWGTRPCYLFAGVFSALGFWATSGIHGLPGFYGAFSLLGGLGTGMLWITCSISVRKWFIGRTYAKMIGLVFAGGPVAQIFLGLLVKALLPNYGWRFAAQVLAAITITVLLLSVWVSSKSPDRYGLKPFGTEAKQNKALTRLWTIRESFSTYPIWAVVLAFLFCQVGEHLIWTQMVSYFVEDLHMSLNKAVNLYAAVGMFGIFLSPTMGLVGDSIVSAVGREVLGRKIVLISTAACAALACLCLLATGRSLAIGIVSCLLFAIYWVVTPGGVVGYAGSVYGQRSLGRIWGLATLISMGIGPASGSYIGGVIRDWTGSYRWPICFSLGAFLVGLILACTLPTSVKVPETAQAIQDPE